MAIPSDAAAQAALGADIARKMEMDALNKRVAPGPNQEKKLKEACEGFEAVFIGQLVKEMRKSVPKDGLLHGSMEDQYVSMFDEEYSKTLAKSGGIGLADFMRGQLSERAKAVSPDDAKGALARGGQPLAPRQGATMAGPWRRTAFDRMPTAKPKPHGQDTMLAPVTGLGRRVPGADQTAAGQAATGQAAQAAHGELAAKAQATRAGLVDAAGRASALAGTPSQKAGLPGAAYLQGPDKALAQTELVQPVSGEITSDFGWRRDPFTHQKAWHSGVDIAAPEGTPVVACADGVVSWSGQRGGYGNLVVVDHADGSQSLYGHNASNAVSVGQAVRAGQQIARVGQTGRATGAHLHFELRRNGQAVDPVSAGTVELAAQDTQERLIPDL